MSNVSTWHRYSAHDLNSAHACAVALTLLLMLHAWSVCHDKTPYSWKIWKELKLAKWPPTNKIFFSEFKIWQLVIVHTNFNISSYVHIWKYAHGSQAMHVYRYSVHTPG